MEGVVLELDVDLDPVGGVACGVAEEVSQDAFEGGGVGFDGHFFRRVRRFGR